MSASMEQSPIWLGKTQPKHSFTGSPGRGGPSRPLPNFPTRTSRSVSPSDGRKAPSLEVSPKRIKPRAPQPLQIHHLAFADNFRPAAQNRDMATSTYQPTANTAVTGITPCASPEHPSLARTPSPPESGHPYAPLHSMIALPKPTCPTPPGP